MFTYSHSKLLTYMLVVYISLSFERSSTSLVVSKTIHLRKQRIRKGNTTRTTINEDSIKVTAPSTHAGMSFFHKNENNILLFNVHVLNSRTAVFKHIDDMTFIKSAENVSHIRQRRNAVTNPSSLWPRGNIPYTISPSFNGMTNT